MDNERQPYADVKDMIALWRPLTVEEQERAEHLLPVVSDTLRQEAKLRGYDLDEMIADGRVLDSVAKVVTVDVTARTIMSTMDGPPLTQETQSALGYSHSMTYYTAALMGGIFVKNDELRRLSLKRQRMEVTEIYDTYPRRYSHAGEEEIQNPFWCYCRRPDE